MKLGGDITRVEFSPDGQMLAIAWGDLITLWNPRSREKLREFKAHDGQVLQIAFSPDGRRLVSMAYDQALKIWEVASGQTLGQPIKAESDWRHGLRAEWPDCGMLLPVWP